MPVSEERMRELYTKQIEKTLSRLKTVLCTQDQDYLNEYLRKVIETSFHRGYLPQKDIPLVAEILNKMIVYDKPAKTPAINEKRDWVKNLDDLIHFTIDVCAVCGSKLHQQGKFPKDYPNEWKLCCHHRDLLVSVFEIEGEQTRFSIREGHRKVDDETAKKIEELFTLQ